MATHRLTTVTAPSVEPVELGDIKDHARIDGADHDGSLERKIVTARRWCENWCSRSFITQTWEYAQDGAPDSYQVELPRPPLQSVTSVTYYSSADVLGTLSADAYIVDTAAGRIFLADGYTWPTDLRAHRSFIVTYVAGYGSDPDSVPGNLREAVLKLTAWMHEHPDSDYGENRFGGAQGQMPLDIRQLLSPECVEWV